MSSYPSTFRSPHNSPFPRPKAPCAPSGNGSSKEKAALVTPNSDTADKPNLNSVKRVLETGKGKFEGGSAISNKTEHYSPCQYSSNRIYHSAANTYGVESPEFGLRNTNSEIAFGPISTTTAGSASSTRAGQIIKSQPAPRMGDQYVRRQTSYEREFGNRAYSDANYGICTPTDDIPDKNAQENYYTSANTYTSSTIPTGYGTSVGNTSTSYGNDATTSFSNQYVSTASSSYTNKFDTNVFDQYTNNSDYVSKSSNAFISSSTGYFSSTSTGYTSSIGYEYGNSSSSANTGYESASNGYQSGSGRSFMQAVGRVDSERSVTSEIGGVKDNMKDNMPTVNASARQCTNGISNARQSSKEGSEVSEHWTIVFLHGIESGPTGKKAQYLERMFSPDSPRNRRKYGHLVPGHDIPGGSSGSSSSQNYSSQILPEEIRSSSSYKVTRVLIPDLNMSLLDWSKKNCPINYLGDLAQSLEGCSSDVLLYLREKFASIPELRGKVKNINGNFDDQTNQNFVKTPPSQKLLLIGSSWGGLVALKTLEKNLVRPDKVLLLAPAIEPNISGFTRAMFWGGEMNIESLPSGPLNQKVLLNGKHHSMVKTESHDEIGDPLSVSTGSTDTVLPDGVERIYDRNGNPILQTLQQQEITGTPMVAGYPVSSNIENTILPAHFKPKAGVVVLGNGSTTAKKKSTLHSKETAQRSAQRYITILHGSLDQTIDIEGSKRFVERFPDVCRLIEIPEGDHSLSESLGICLIDGEYGLTFWKDLQNVIAEVIEGNL